MPKGEIAYKRIQQYLKDARKGWESRMPNDVERRVCEALEYSCKHDTREGILIEIVEILGMGRIE